MPGVTIANPKKWLKKYYLWLISIGFVAAAAGFLGIWFLAEPVPVLYEAVKPYNIVTGPPENEFKRPTGVAVGLRGELFIIDSGNQRIIVMEEDGRFSMKFGGPGSGRAELAYPVGIDVSPDGKVYIADEGKKAVLVFNSLGEYLYTINGDTPENFVPLSVKCDKKGNAFVFNAAAKKFWVYSPENKNVLQVPAGKVTFPDRLTSVDLDPEEDRFYGVNREKGKFYELAGDIFTSYGAGRITVPSGIVYNRSQKLVLISDAYKNKIIVFNRDGTYLGEFGHTGSEMDGFDNPSGLALDERGKLYVADTDNNRIVIYSF